LPFFVLLTLVEIHVQVDYAHVLATLIVCGRIVLLISFKDFIQSLL